MKIRVEFDVDRNALVEAVAAVAASGEPMPRSKKGILAAARDAFQTYGYQPYDADGATGEQLDEAAAIVDKVFPAV